MLSKNQIRILLLPAIFALPAALRADEIVVPTEMPLSVALATAVSGDTITVLPGVYQQNPGYAFANKRLTIRGSTGNPADVVLDGAALDIVLRISGAPSDGSIIQDLTIRNGRGGPATDASGAGVHLTDANVTFRNCVVRDNTIPGPDGNGAGIYGTLSSVRIEDCLIEGNGCPSSLSDGGGVYLNSGSHTILRTTFRANGVAPATALAAGSIGGAFYADGGATQLTQCYFENNRASEGGAIGVSGSMVMTIDACVFTGNAARSGGAFYTTASTTAASRIRNCLLVGNTASVNEAAVFTSKAAAITNCTVAGNATTGSYIIGGAPPAGSVFVDNCVIWGNTMNAANGIFPAAMGAVARRNILQQAYTGGSGTAFNTVVDPLFMSVVSADYRLQAASPAIDAGDSNLYFGPFADLDGLDRAVDVPAVPDTGSSITGPVVDIGAYEVQTAPPPPDCAADFNHDGDLNSQDFFEFLTAFFAGCP